jgi:hypothetical protein
MLEVLCEILAFLLPLPPLTLLPLSLQLILVRVPFQAVSGFLLIFYEVFYICKLIEFIL